MVFRTWAVAAEALDGLRPCNRAQQQLAESLGLALDGGAPAVLAAAMLRVAVAPYIGLPDPREPMDWQYERLADLGARLGVKPVIPLTDIEARAYIEHYWARIRADALRALRAETGDVVEFEDRTREGSFIISSIGGQGRLYFLGGRASAWPDEVRVVARAGDTSDTAQQAATAARNAAALSRGRIQTSSKTLELMAQWQTFGSPTALEIEELRSVIETARDEAQIQQYLQMSEHKHLLTSLLGGQRRWLRAQVHLGSEYVPDFVVGEEDSLGVRWLLVELETPHSSIALRSKESLDKCARQGVDQIKSWRRWLQGNLTYARNLPSDHGLGLVGIHPQAPGLVLVGRRDRLIGHHAGIRLELEQVGIQVHTYDWLLERLQAIRSFSGPPAMNRHLLRIVPLEHRDLLQDAFDKAEYDL